MEKILSLIIPTYNMEKYLDKCLTSLIIDDKELMKQFEVFVVIDGATDSSSEIAHIYETRFPDTYKVIDKENGNYGSCINRGLKEITGKYVKVLDADDWFDTEVLKDFLAFLKSRDEDCILSAFNIVGCKEEIKEKWNLNFEHGNVFKIDDIKPQQMSMHAVTYKIDVLRKCSYNQTEGISYTDTEWFYIPVAYAETFVYYSKPLYQYLVGRNGQTVDCETVARKISQPILIVEKMIDKYYLVDVDKSHKIYMYGCIERMIEYIYRIILNECDCRYNVEVLAMFDKKLKKTEFYHVVDKCTYRGLKYYYILDWRRNGYKSNLSRWKIYYYSKKKRFEEIKYKFKILLIK